MQKPIVTPVALDNLCADSQKILDLIPGNGLKGEFAPINVLGTLLYGKNLLGDFLTYWVNAKNNMTLNCREQEIIILRMGYHYQSNYVWKHHIPVAKEFEITDNEIEVLSHSIINCETLSNKEVALLAFCDQMVLKRNVTNELWEKYQDVLTTENVLDLIHLVSQYVVFALTNNIFRVEVESSLDQFKSLH